MARAPVKLRLVTSEEDAFLAAVKAASARMKDDGVPHELLVVPGTHGYDFNRGPGSAELLLGNVLNTHLRFLAESLFPLGLRVGRSF